MLRPFFLKGRRHAPEARKGEPMKEHIVQTNYGFGGGWEDSTTDDSRSEALRRLSEYRKNQPEYSHRLVSRAKKETNHAEAEFSHITRATRDESSACGLDLSQKGTMSVTAKGNLKIDFGTASLVIGNTAVEFQTTRPERLTFLHNALSRTDLETPS